MSFFLYKLGKIWQKLSQEYWVKLLDRSSLAGSQSNETSLTLVGTTTEKKVYKQQQEVSIVKLSDLRWEFIKENKEVRKQENKISTKKVIKKKRIVFLFSWSLSWSSSCFLDRFLGRVLVFFFSWSLSWSSSCFYVFLITFLVEFLFS